MSQSFNQTISAMFLNLIQNSPDIDKYLERMKIEIRFFFDKQTVYENFCNQLNQCSQPIHYNKLQLMFDYLGKNNFINLLMICDYIEDAQQLAPALIQDQSVVKLISDIKRDANSCNLLELDYTGVVIKFGIHDEKGKERTPNSYSNAYPLEGEKRGYFYIVVNVPTIGTLKQMRYLAEIFHALKFEIKFRINMTETEIRNDLQAMLPLKGQTDNHYAFIFYYLGHGSVNAIDGFDKILDNKNHLNHSEILTLIIESQLYSERKSVSLIYDCCRISDIEFTVNQTQVYSDILPRFMGINIPLNNGLVSPLYVKEKMPKLKDIFICNSTQEGYEASIYYMEGTLFGRNFAKRLVKSAVHRSLYEIFTETSTAMEEDLKQIITKASVDKFGKVDSNWIEGKVEKYFNPIDPNPNGSRRHLFLGMNIDWDNSNSDYSTLHCFKPNP